MIREFQKGASLVTGANFQVRKWKNSLNYQRNTDVSVVTNSTDKKAKNSSVISCFGDFEVVFVAVTHSQGFIAVSKASWIFLVFFISANRSVILHMLIPWAFRYTKTYDIPSKQLRINRFYIYDVEILIQNVDPQRATS